MSSKSDYKIAYFELIFHILAPIFFPIDKEILLFEPFEFFGDHLIITSYIQARYHFITMALPIKYHQLVK